MTIKKVISGGLSVSDQAALDAAIRLGIPHGGYIPWGRMTEIGMLPSKYKLEVLNTDDHLAYIEKNIEESKGTLIISAGNFNEDAEYARKMTMKHTHQFFVVDLELTIASEAATLVNDWIQMHKVDVLYVMGPLVTEYRNVDKHVTVIIEGALMLDIMDAPLGSRIQDYPRHKYLQKIEHPNPKTVDEALDQIISDMSLEERVRLANYDKEELWVVNYSLSIFIRNQLFTKDVSQELFESCRAVSDNKNLNEATAALVIIEKLWERLRTTHRLRIVK